MEGDLIITALTLKKKKKNVVWEEQLLQISLTSWAHQSQNSCDTIYRKLCHIFKDFYGLIINTPNVLVSQRIYFLMTHFYCKYTVSSPENTLSKNRGAFDLLCWNLTFSRNRRNTEQERERGREHSMSNETKRNGLFVLVILHLFGEGWTRENTVSLQPRAFQQTGQLNNRCAGTLSYFSNVV